MQCTATTNAGKPCGGGAIEGEGLCGPHRDQAYAHWEQEEAKTVTEEVTERSAPMLRLILLVETLRQFARSVKVGDEALYTHIVEFVKKEGKKDSYETFWTAEQVAILLPALYEFDRPLAHKVTAAARKQNIDVRIECRCGGSGYYYSGKTVRNPNTGVHEHIPSGPCFGCAVKGDEKGKGYQTLDDFWRDTTYWAKHARVSQ